MQSPGPARGFVLRERDESIVILVMKLHVALRLVHYLLLHLPEIPFRELIGGDEPVSRADIDLGKKFHDAMGDVELRLVVNVILGIREVLPFWLGLHGGGVAIGEVVTPLPLTVITAALDVSYNGVKGGTPSVAT